MNRIPVRMTTVVIVMDRYREQRLLYHHYEQLVVTLVQLVVTRVNWLLYTEWYPPVTAH